MKITRKTPGQNRADSLGICKVQWVLDQKQLCRSQIRLKLSILTLLYNLLVGKLTRYSIYVFVPETEGFFFKSYILFPRMANVFYGDVFMRQVALGKTIFQGLVGIYNFSKRFYFVKDPEVMRKA